MSEQFKHPSRSILGIAAIMIAAAQFGMLGCAESKRAEPPVVTRPGPVTKTGGSITMPVAAQRADGEAASIFVDKIPDGYRDWKLISVSHEEGNLHSIGAILGNDAAIKAYREGKLPFPDGAVIAALHWRHVPSEENNKVFGRSQSFIAGPPTNVQFMVKDAKKYASSGGWGFGQFDDGKPVAKGMLKSCFACHALNKDRDLVFTRYAP
jgi:hypothetical protein